MCRSITREHCYCRATPEYPEDAALERASIVGSYERLVAESSCMQVVVARVRCH